MGRTGAEGPRRTRVPAAWPLHPLRCRGRRRDVFAREATIAGADLREIITFEPERKVAFFQVAGPREGVIINELFEAADGTLHLRFYCYLGLRDKEPNGPEEQAEQAQFDSAHGYKAALLSTLKRTRELLSEGRL